MVSPRPGRPAPSQRHPTGVSGQPGSSANEPAGVTGWQVSVLHRPLVFSLALVLVVFIAYWPAVGNDFVNYDDDQYVTQNRHVRGGLTWAGIGWTVTSVGYAGNWHPLTWLSHLLDVSLFGLNPRGHHVVNIGLHAGNAVLLFLGLRAMTGALWRSALVAALFAVHPLHVESVAWVAERKDVLSTFFWLLATAAYVWYVRRRSLGRYLAVVGAFALGLLAKPMLVTLPFVFLVLDYWPLGRMRPLPRVPQPATGGLRPGYPMGAPPQQSGGGDWVSLVRKKLPLFALSAVSAAMTWVAQARFGAVQYALPFRYRLTNAIVAYVGYLWKTIWPVNLAVFYPHPGDSLPVWRVLAASLFLATVTAVVFWHRRRRPYLVAGWLWYLGTLVPLIGLVQVGVQAMADRYTYIPLIGIFILAAWGLPESVLTGPQQRKAAVGAGAVLLAVLMTLTWIQTTYWRDGQALFEHALGATGGNWVVHNSLGVAYAKLGMADEAIGHLKEALRLQPDFPQTNHNMGHMMAMNSKLDEAGEYFRKAIRLKPDYTEAHNGLGAVLFEQGKLGEALEHFQEALRRDPDYAAAHFNIGVVLERMGRVEEAVLEYRTTLRLSPDHQRAQTALQEALKKNPALR